jgi:hypothetical protein
MGSFMMDSAAYIQSLAELKRDLSDDYDVRSFAFDSDVRSGEGLNFQGQGTDISKALDGVTERFYGQNLGAVVLASDGLYNQGTNPVYSGARLTAPLFALALGDTTTYKDLILSKVLHNRIAYLGDRINLRIDLEAYHANGESTPVTISRIEKGNSSKVYSQVVPIDEAYHASTVSASLEAKHAGIQHYRVEWQVIDGESNLENNARDVFIEVIDGRQKIAILHASPHPDIAAIKRTIETNKNYEVHVKDVRNTGPNELGAYNLLIAHQVPARSGAGSKHIQKATQEELPILFVLGRQTHLHSFNQLQDLFGVLRATNDQNDVTASPVDAEFSLFKFEEQDLEKLAALPPLKAPFGQFKTSPNAARLLNQKIGNLVTDYPLLVFNQGVSHRIAVLAGEGFWQWRQHDHRMHGTSSATTALINKTIQYLSAKKDKRQFRVILPTNNFSENDQISVRAELYNDAYELVNDPDVQIRISDESGKDYPFVFGREGAAYQLNAGSLPMGNYTYYASTTFGGKLHENRGAFSVSAVRVEALQTVADHHLLSLLASKYGGEVVQPDQVGELVDKISSRPDLKPILYNAHANNPLIELRWVAILLLTFLGIEWFARKYQGAY